MSETLWGKKTTKQTKTTSPHHHPTTIVLMPDLKIDYLLCHSIPQNHFRK